ncbi:helix-turn-helix transcriptional regulator [Alkalimonas sp. MEB108]|uniref:Helix-turn-helix transcriptional regulator n=1 Tax=Alkalimonas cellulosilytica TaxID=3058395 RepID=A0ABU7J804_9GAMM|nr:helix-turn-helix transcriptional regulator [Alkalimonas sp. MEB108]MEE2002663.1 helix-turn-helix transcriptional regulator [Alkalimonas sp. MEB108]
MAIQINLDVMLAVRKMKSNELAEKIGITPQNLSVLRSGRAKAIRFSTLNEICKALDCQPGDILAFLPGNDDDNEDTTHGS